MSDNDDRAREAIRTALDETLVVEAAAGTGKTTELVGRILAVLAGGAEIQRIVAVTFTEKAAGELKLRLRTEIERSRRQHPDRAVVERLGLALQRLEESRVSTIHGFCADLLRERPVEARVDPQFQVLTEEQAERHYSQTFNAWLQEKLSDPPEGVRRSLRRPARQGDEDGPVERLRRAGLELVQWRDFPESWSRDPFDRTGAIDRLLDQLHELADLTESPSYAKDNLFVDTQGVRRLSTEIRRARAAGTTDYDRWEAGLVSLGRDWSFRRGRKGSGASYRRGVNRIDVLALRQNLALALEDFQRTADADLAAALHEELIETVRCYESQKAKLGALDFLDLLLRARDLVRDLPGVRAEFQERFTHIFVDEFQDTDPLQAEILLLLASDDPAEDDWRRVRPRPGKLFIVGDPKQSIYRFRRADVGMYQEARQMLVDRGAHPIELTRSYRAVPGIQSAINTAFAPLMTGDRETLQAGYVPLAPYREGPRDQPSLVVLPVPRPYSSRAFGAPSIGLAAVEESLPGAVGAFLDWLLNQSEWTVAEREPGTDAGGGARERRVRVQPRHVCLLFRRFVSWGRDMTRAYIDAIESRGIPHLLVGGKSFHDREEVETIRATLTAIEWPDDELSVFAALRGSFFAIGDEDLLDYHHRYRHFQPFRVPDDLPPHLDTVGAALGLLRRLHAGRNARPVADTLWQLLEATRAHVGFVLRRSGEQVLANVLHVAELARRYEASGGISFRGFLDALAAEADRGQGEEAPILEEASDGVRLMTVHKAKGLEFPVVVLADMTGKLRPNEASRYLDPERRLCAMRIGPWRPAELRRREAEELAREEQEGIRIAYVAATRARDLLVVPAIGDQAFEGGWVSPLNQAVYPRREVRRQAHQAPGCPTFKSRDTVLERPNGEGASDETVCPGLHDLDGRYSVVWWDPGLLAAERDYESGLRREELVTKEAPTALVREGLDAYRRWQEGRADAIRRAATPSVQVRRAGEWVAGDHASDEGSAAVEVVELPVDRSRPSGRRFGTLVHAVLASAPLDASRDVLDDVTGVQGRVLGASPAEVAAAAAVVERVLAQDLLARARTAVRTGRCRRETPITLTLADGTLVEGVVDLAFQDDSGWTVLDFKTDQELAGALDQYRRQVALYADAIARATSAPARGVLMRV